MKRRKFSSYSSLFKRIVLFLYSPAMFELNATPTPHMPLFALPEEAPAQRVPWLKDFNNYENIFFIDTIDLK